MKRSARADPLRHCGGRLNDLRPAHAIALRADFAAGVDGALRIEPAHQRLGVTRYRIGLEQRAHWRDFLAKRRIERRRHRDGPFGAPVEGIDHQHGVTAFGQSFAHLLHRRT